LNTFDDGEKVVKRSIGIDIGRTYLRAVQVAWTGGQCVVEKAFCSQTRRSTDSPPQILKAFFSRHGFDRRAAVGVALPPGQVFFRDVETDLEGLEKIRRQGLSELEHEFPVPKEEVIKLICSYRQLDTQRYSVLIAATRRTSLNEMLDLLGEVKKQPQLVQPTIFAVYSSLAVNYPEIAAQTVLIAHVMDDRLILAVTENGRLLIVRHIPLLSAAPQPAGDFRAADETAEILAREAEITWRKVFASEPGEDVAVYLATGTGLPPGASLEAAVAQTLGRRIITADPHARIRPPSPEQTNPPRGGWVAEGLALELLAPKNTDSTDILDARPARRDACGQTTKLKKDFATCLGLAACIGLVWLVGLFVRLSYLRTEHERLKANIEKTFISAVGDETKIVNPTVQLDQMLSSLRKQYRLLSGRYPGEPSPLEVLQYVTINTPPDANVKLDDLLVGAGSLRVSGFCRSFDAVYQWRKLLQKVDAFESVEIGDNLQKDPKSGDVRFSIFVSTKGKDW